ncbi:MAG: efflux transporter outer membrane subunit [Candidatus Omnitrophota bacterium]|jgi:multidrug efflux system outer membrane protein
MKRIVVLILGVVCFNGCTLAPKYNRPKAPIPGTWPIGDAYLQAQPATGVVDAERLKWREFFTDPKLQRIIETALENNRDLKLAALNVEKARGLYGIQRAELFPGFDAQGGLTKEHFSSDFITPGSPRTTEKYSVNLGVTAWEVDFFGRIRSLKKKALEEYLSTEEARRSAQITLVSEIAQAYLTVAADRANLNLAQSILNAQEGVYNLVQRKHKLKLVNEIDLYRAQTQMDAAYGDLVRYTQQAAKDKNALELLAGDPVPEDLLPFDLESVRPLRDIFPGLSSEVLFRRPDIMEAEHQLKGAYADIGAARAAFFPSISLTTALGSASSDLSNLFKTGKDTWIFAPKAVMPVFDARTWSAYRVSEANRKIALTRYEKTIQTAFREVADVLAVQGTVDRQITGQQSIVDSARKIYDLSSKRYATGIDNYLSVLDAQRSLYGAQQGLIFAQLSKLVNEVRAYAVLGGGGLEDKVIEKRAGRDLVQENVLSSLGSEAGKSKP